MPDTKPTQELQKSAKRELKAIAKGQLTRSESAALVMNFIKAEEKNILERHRNGAGGIEIATARANLLDAVLNVMFQAAIQRYDGDTPKVALVAQGGYGRCHLNPGSDYTSPRH